jgi:hypothetical protein
MAAIYDKALKRKDYSGIIDKEKQKEAADKKAGTNGKVHVKFSLFLVCGINLALFIYMCR